MNINTTVVFDDPNLSLWQADGWYTYAHMSRTEAGQLVACLVYRRDRDGQITHFLGRFETCLPHADGMSLTSITGGVDKGSWHLPTVCEELKQEAGIPEDVLPAAHKIEDAADILLNDVASTRLQYHGTCRPSKQEDTLCHLYSYDATGLTLTESTTDGTKGEEGSYCHWVEPHIMLGCKCPLVPAIAVRMGFFSQVR